MTRDSQQGDPSPGDPSPTEPVEVQRFGPTPSSEPVPSTWQRAPAWSTQPPTQPSPVQRRGGRGAGVVALAVVAGILSGALSAVAVTNLLDERTPSTANTSTDGTSGNPISDVRIDESSAVINAVEQVAPAVVTIRSSAGSVPGATGSGSGFIFDPAGWILTNRHVVDGASDLTVILNDGREFPAELYGIDTLTDLAIIKINAEGELPAAPIGTSAGLEPGQLAIAIGNPLGNYENTVTTGVVSGLGRRITASDSSNTSAEQLNNLIQTDAAINPGNSGGPLVNSAGQVIGINTAVSTNAQGLGFAIPIDIAKPIMEQALNGDELTRPWIGIYYVTVDPQVAADQNLSVDYGALISATGGPEAVFPGSPAADAGLQEGDVILELDGTRVDAEHDLATLILPHAPGDAITLLVLRDGQERQVQVTLGTLPEQP
jgi:serine protease Do